MEIYVGMSASTCLLSNVNPLPLLPVSWNCIPLIAERLFRWLEWEPATNSNPIPRPPPPLHTLYWAPPSIHLPATHAYMHTQRTLRKAGQLMEQHERTLISLVGLLVTCLFMGEWKMNRWGWVGMKHSFVGWPVLKICPLLVLSSILCKNSCLSTFIQVPWMSFTHFPQVLFILVETGFTSYWVEVNDCFIWGDWSKPFTFLVFSTQCCTLRRPEMWETVLFSLCLLLVCYDAHWSQ